MGLLQRQAEVEQMIADCPIAADVGLLLTRPQGGGQLAAKPNGECKL